MLKRLAIVLCSAALLTAAPAPKGTLVIVGGGGMPQEILDAFLKASGGKGGRVGIVPTSTEDPEGALKEWKEDLDKAGLTMVPLDVRKREDASSPAILEAAKTFEGIAKVEKEHEARFKRLLDHVVNGTVFQRGEKIYWRCRNCGHIHEGTTAPKTCPVCLHPQAYFEPVAENF